MNERREKAQILDAAGIVRAITRIAHEIVERNKGIREVVLVGLRSRGVGLAHRIASKLEEIEKVKVPVGALDITLYRDDLGRVVTQPIVQRTEISFPINDKKVVLVDDVLYTGRTIRAALDALFDKGRPARVQLLTLIDRGWRELPIEARYVGRMVQTTANEIIEVKFQEIDGLEKVLLVEKVPD